MKGIAIALATQKLIVAPEQAFLACPRRQPAGRSTTISGIPSPILANGWAFVVRGVATRLRGCPIASKTTVDVWSESNLMGFLSGLEHCVREGEPLSAHTWFRFGGLARYWAEPTSLEDLTTIIKRSHNEGVAVRLLGGGSNVVVRDAGVEGVVVHLSAPVFSQMNVQGKRLKVGGGAKLSHVVSMCASQGLAGMEQLVGIPGVVGGALHGNAGSQVADIGQWVVGATVMTRNGEIVVRSPADLQFSHRDSSLNELVILDAALEFEEDDPQMLTQKMQQTWIVSKAKQPTIGQYTGCIFKDSGGVSASSLIEDAGLKGERIGEVAICERNANFMVAEPGAQCDDLLSLIDLVRRRVSEQLGVDLELQIEIW